MDGFGDPSNFSNNTTSSLGFACLSEMMPVAWETAQTLLYLTG